MNIAIRTAQLNDLDDIMIIEENGFDKTIQENKEIFKTRIEECNNLFLIFTDTDSNRTIGYLSAELFSNIPEKAEQLKLNHKPEKTKSEKYIYISSFSILPEYRGSGTGKDLWNRSLTLLQEKNNKDLILLVNSEWKAAKHIYEESGFKTINIFKNFFQNKETISDGILMLRKN